MSLSKIVVTLGLAVLGSAVAGAAYAYCPTLDCTEDPQAWAKAIGSTQQRSAEQNAAAAAAQKHADANFFSGVPLLARAKIIYGLEQQFTQLLGAPYRIATVTVVGRGSDYLFCGSGAYGRQGGVFIFDTAPGGIHNFNVDKATFVKSDCNASPSVVLR